MSVLHHRLRAGVRNHGAVQVAQQFLLGDRKLDDVAHLPEGVARQEGEPALNQHLRAGVPAAWQDHAGVREAAEVSSNRLPERVRIHIHGAVDIDERVRAACKQCSPIGALSILDLQPAGAGSTQCAQVLHVHVQLPAARGLRKLRKALAQDAAVGPELVPVQALHAPGELQRRDAGGRRLGTMLLGLRLHGHGRQHRHAMMCSAHRLHCRHVRRHGHCRSGGCPAMDRSHRWEGGHACHARCIVVAAGGTRVAGQRRQLHVRMQVGRLLHAALHAVGSHVERHEGSCSAGGVLESKST
mmetsp:Transcript_2036/g.5822  ORF Transcript_2036/g.5822 Transcript_2036/m.5822 type:complete len:299 (+) Transcript_2036:409-1305(+)